MVQMNECGPFPFMLWDSPPAGLHKSFLPPIFPFLQKNPEEDCSTRTLPWEPGHLMLTLYVIRSMEQLLPFFNLLSQVFNSKASSRSGSTYTHNPADASFPSQKEGHKLESQKVFWSQARQNIEEMVEKDFLEGLIKT